jgi:general secretion pathway protein J
MPTIAIKNLREQGFTLIEVLLAMALTALIGVMAYQGLSSAINALESQETEVTSITNLQTAWRIIGEDLQQATYREITDEEEETKESFIGGGDDKEILMEFTRSGWANPLGQRRSEIQRVRYLLKDRQLWREHWLTLDRLKEPEPIRLMLLENIDSAKLEFFAPKKANREGGEWLDSWPEEFADSSPTPSNIPDQNKPNENSPNISDDLSSLPMAVKITLDSDDWGSIDRLYLLPDSDE